MLVFERIRICNLLLMFFSVFLVLGCDKPMAAHEWPEISNQSKPWTRWWWQGSSVTREGITAELESLYKAGLGGVEITPIYGVIGDEDHFIDYLSPQWMDMLEFTLSEAQRIGLGVDMANGTGWPFGGPWVQGDEACKYLAHKKYKVKGGQRLTEKVQYQQDPFVRAVTNQVYQLYGIYRDKGEKVMGTMNDPELLANMKPLTIDDLVDPVESNENLQAKALDQVRYRKILPLQSLIAYGPESQMVNLTAKVDSEGNLDWTAPEGNWRLYALFQGQHGKMVERAAPGGEGNVIDHFSSPAIQNYLARFDSAFAGRNISGIRAFFNDSYEVDDAWGQANWTPDFLQEFERRRGYDLNEYLPALFGDDDEEINIRVLSDFRETFSDLILETFTQKWAEWAKGKGKMIRNQSHGSPANILDLYAASDIPETEGTEILRIKFASSAAHVAGRQLVSAEAATWLDEHFLSNLAQVKENLDRYLVGGVNHLFYHGNCYSPPGDEWPGRLFYAAIHNNSRNPLWHDWPALNKYIERVQSFLQSGRPDNNILLYFPMYDRFATPGDELLEHFDGHGPTLEGTPLEETALQLQEQGYAFDFISDRQILDLNGGTDGLQTINNKYHTLLVPPCNFMPLATLEKLIQLAQQGAKIVFVDHLPKSIPGMANLEEKKVALESMFDALNFQNNQCRIGKGYFLRGQQISEMLTQVGISRESLVDQGLEFTKRKVGDESIYFISNWSGDDFSDWVDLGADGNNVILFDPMSGEIGRARSRNDGHIYLQLLQGESYVAKVGIQNFDVRPWSYYQATANNISFDGNWSVRFVEGGPVLPPDLEDIELGSWTNFGDAYKNFSGRAIYNIGFPAPDGDVENWILDLGQVNESAQVRINGQDIGTLIGPKYKLVIPTVLFQEENHLEVEVSNLMANRIAYMDRNNIYWKKFYNVNFPPRRADNRGRNGLFDASSWEPVSSGLLGPVQLYQAKDIGF